MNTWAGRTAAMGVVILMAAAAVAGLARLRSQEKPGETTALVSLASAMEQAVAAASPERMQALTAPGVRNDYRWVREWPRSAMTDKPWHAGLLRWTPARAGRPVVLLLISRPHVTQSTSDHLYEVAGTSAAPRIGPEVPEDELMGARVVAHDLQVEFVPGLRRVVIQDTATVRRMPSRLGIAIYRLNEYYRVSEVLVDGKPVPYARAGGFLLTDVPSSDRVLLTARYAVNLSSTGESYVSTNEAAITAYWFVHTARQPFTARTRITAPSGWRSISTGILVGEDLSGAKWTSVWKNDIPICFMMAVAGRYHVSTRDSRGTAVSCWLLQPSEDRANEAIRTASQAIEWFGSHFAPFPYPKYAVVESRVFPPALEGYSFTLAGAATIPGVITHEVSHTWWGGLIPNTYLHSMWNESFATYSESLFSRLTQGSPPDPGVGAMEEASRLLDRPTIVEATDAMHPDHSAVGYQKGALVLAQFERVIGTQTMLRTLREFVARHRRGEAAEWSDYISVAESVAGAPGRGFLQPWLEQPGLPRYELRNIAVVQQGQGYQVRGTVQAAEPVRPCRASIRLRDERYQHDIELLIRAPATPFQTDIRFRPTHAAFDPEGLVPRRPSPVADLTR